MEEEEVEIVGEEVEIIGEEEEAPEIGMEEGAA
jgi:hypothetical protein